MDFKHEIFPIHQMPQTLIRKHTIVDASPTFCSNCVTVLFSLVGVYYETTKLARSYRRQNCLHSKATRRACNMTVKLMTFVECFVCTCPQLFLLKHILQRLTLFCPQVPYTWFPNTHYRGQHLVQD